jgi:hypothetical protein
MSSCALIRYYIRRSYGNDRQYLKDPKVIEAMRLLNGHSVLTDNDRRALELLGHLFLQVPDPRDLKFLHLDATTGDVAFVPDHTPRATATPLTATSPPPSPDDGTVAYSLPPDALTP